MPVEAPNTLRSRARYKIIDIISQGPIRGLVNGAKSVYLDETPIQAANGTLNFKNFQISTDLQQLPIPDISGQLIKNNPALFPLSENEVSVSAKVTKDSPEGSLSGDGSLTRTISDTDVDSVRVTMRVPALTTTNTATGDITGGQISFKIEVKPDGGDFMPAQAGNYWRGLTLPNPETSDGATGIDLTVEISNAAYFYVTWQYRKKTGGTWGDWFHIDSLYIPASSSSSSQYGAYNPNAYMAPQSHTKAITGLAPGIYQIRAVGTSGTVTYLSAREFTGGSMSISGKTTSPYDADYIVQLPGTGPWDIKVSRISADPPTANIQGDLYWLSYTEQISNRFSWPNTAGVAITFDAEDFGGNIPTRAYDVMGLMVKIPANYDPYTRTYTGVWNGTFKTDWTDNPAWIFYDLLTNKRYGLGDNIDPAQVDKYALYQIAQYCDELVDAPAGGQEPRYTCSCVINTQSEAYELLTAIASAFRGMIYHAGGIITPTADMPSDPILNVGPANVIDGNFTYQGASRKSRHTVARVSWNNPDDGYKLNVELYEDDVAIRKYGYRPIDINAFGCTSRGLARRWGKWSVVSDNDAPDTVTYKAGFDHFKLRPGDVINIADPNYSGEQLFGLIANVVDNVSPATHTITLDRAVTRLAGDTSELQVTLADGTILLLDVAVLSNTTGNTITIDSVDLTDTPLIGASWLLKKGTVEPRKWRVISVSEDEPNIYQVTAMLYDPNKFDKVETDLNFAEADFTAFPDGPMPAPTALITSEFLKQTGSAILACVNLSWTRPNDPRADWFEVQYQVDGEEWRGTEPNITQFTGIDIFNIVPETYNFRVRAQDTSGLFRSAWTNLPGEVLSGKNKKPEDVTGFTAVIEKYGVLLNWSPVSDIDINYYEIRRGASWAAGDFVGRTAGTVFKWEDATEAAYTFWIKALDTQTPANESVSAASATATVAVEATPSVVGTTAQGGISVAISGTTTNRFAHYELQRKKTTEVDGAAVTVNALLASREFTDTLVAALGYVPLYQYRARAFNKNLNASAYSDWSDGVNPGQISSADLVDGALNRSDLFVSGVVNATAIANGAVTAIKTTLAAIDSSTGDLNANTVNALQINAGAVTTEKLYALAVTAAKIAGGAVTAEKLLVGAPGAALNDDPGFQDASAWTVYAGSPVQIATVADGIVGNKALRGYSDGSANHYRSNKQTPIDRTKTYRISALLRKNGSPTNSGSLGFYEFGQDGAFLGTTTYYSLYGFMCDALTTSFERHALIVVPANFHADTRFIAVSVLPGYMTTGGYVDAQDVRIEECLPATLIQDGAIVTDKLAVNAVTAGKISAGAVETANLAANAVTADKVDATVVKTTELQVYGKNRCIDPAFDGIPYSSTYSSLTFTSVGNRVGNWEIVESSGLAASGGYHKLGSIAGIITDYGSNAVALGLAFDSTTAYRAVLSDKFLVKPSCPYYFSISCYSGSSKGTVELYAMWYSSSLSYLGSSLLLTPFTATTTATRKGGAVVANASAVYGAFYIKLKADTSLGGGNLTFGAAQVEEGSVATAWVNREQGTITADRVVTGQIKSLNYSTTAGSLIDLNSGDIKMGGSSAPRFSFTNSTNTGVVAGFTFNATDMTAGATNTAIGISTDTAKKAFWAGSETPASAPFFVSHDGSMTAKSGSIASFSISASQLYVSGVAGGGYGGKVRLDSTAGNIGSEWSYYVNASNRGSSYTAIGIDGLVGSTTETISGSNYGDTVYVRPSSGSSTNTAPIYVLTRSASYYSFYCNSNIYVGGNCSASSFTDRTEMPKSIKEAEEIINTMQSVDGKVDYKRLSNKAKSFSMSAADGKESEVEEGRDLTKTVSALVMVCQKLQEEVIRLQMRIANIEPSDEHREYEKLSEELTEDQRQKLWADYEKDKKK